MTTEAQHETPPLSYSIKGAAENTGCSVSHIRKMVAEGYLPTVTGKGSGKPLILRSDLEAWLNPDAD